MNYNGTSRDSRGKGEWGRGGWSRGQGGVGRMVRVQGSMREPVAQWSDSNAKGSGFGACQGQEFSRSYETPELLGAGDSHVLRMR
jgi:hypothetical protein